MSAPDEVVIDHDPDHPMTAALRDLVKARALTGAVLVSFTGDRIGVNSSSPDRKLGAVMNQLADLILADFMAGRYDAALDAGETRQ